MLPIDNVNHALIEAAHERVDLRHLTVTAWRNADVTKLDAAIAQALGYKEVSVADVFHNALVGPVCQIVAEYSRDPRHVIDADDLDECINEYSDLIRRMTGTKSEQFLREARFNIRRAIHLSINARFYGVTLEQHFRATPIGQSLSFVIEVVQYYRDYLEQNSLIDVPIMLAADVHAIETCALCLLDPLDLPPLGLQALRRLLPRAFFCAISP